MRIFKASWKDKTGKTRETKKWWIETRDHKNTLRRFPGFTDRKNTEDLGRQIERLISSKAAGEQPGPALSRWLESIPDSLTRQLVRIGLLDSQRAAGGKPLSEHLEDYELCLQAKGDTPEYIKLTIQRIRQIFTDCKFTTWGDISASKLQRYLAGLKDGENGIGNQTHNYYLVAVKGFCRWMIQDRRASESPLSHLKGLNVRTDRRHDRRALEPDEIRRLLETTRRQPARYHMTGPERALLYRLAAESGLRANEIRSLKKSSFDFDKCLVTVKAAYSKRKREDVLPLKSDIVSEIENHLSNKLPDAPAFHLPSKWNMADMLKKDLAAAEIDYQDEAGRFADFHSLRHTTGSLLAASGVHPKVAQSLMRHSTVELTLGRYSHIYKGQESDAIASLPDLTAPSQQQQEARATGTDDRTAPEPLTAIARESGQTEKPGEDPEKNLACFLAKIGGNQPFSADNARQPRGKISTQKNIHKPLQNNGKSLLSEGIKSSSARSSVRIEQRISNP